MVAERGQWNSKLANAYELLKQGDKDKALYIFAQYAALGYESAQFNAAYMLSQRRGSSESFCPTILPRSEVMRCAAHSQVDQFLNHSIPLQDVVIDDNSTTTTTVEYVDLPMAFTRAADHFFNEIVNGSAATEMVYRGGADSAQSSLLCDARAMMLFGLSASQGNSEAHQVEYLWRLVLFVVLVESFSKRPIILPFS